MVQSKLVFFLSLPPPSPISVALSWPCADWIWQEGNVHCGVCELRGFWWMGFHRRQKTAWCLWAFLTDVLVGNSACIRHIYSVHLVTGISRRSVLITPDTEGGESSLAFPLLDWCRPRRFLLLMSIWFSFLVTSIFPGIYSLLAGWPPCPYSVCPMSMCWGIGGLSLLDILPSEVLIVRILGPVWTDIHIFKIISYFSFGGQRLLGTEMHFSLSLDLVFST